MSPRTTLAPDPAVLKRQGMVAMCLAMSLLPVGDAIAKLLTGIAAPLEVTMWRLVFQALAFIPVGIVMRRHLSGTMFSGAALVSGALTAVILFGLIASFQAMPIATAIAIFFIEPLLLTLLSGPLLGEIAGPRRYAAVAVGLVGALIVIRPNFIEFGPVVLLPVLSALAYALNMILVRHATRNRSALSFQIGAAFYAAGILVALAVGLAALGRLSFEVIGGPGWGIWAAMGAGGLSAFTYLLIAIAFSKTEASILAPFQYLEIVGATAVGFLIFGDFPDAMTWLGIAIILTSGIYVFHRERSAKATGATGTTGATNARSGGRSGT